MIRRRGVPGMKATLLARRLGLDGNPLRRRTDKIAACLAGLLVAVFLIGAPSLALAAIGWAGPAGVTGQHATRVSRQVPVTGLQLAPRSRLRMEPKDLPPGAPPTNALDAAGRWFAGPLRGSGA
jgi:hypothetical protein